MYKNYTFLNAIAISTRLRVWLINQYPNHHFTPVDSTIEFVNGFSFSLLILLKRICGSKALQVLVNLSPCFSFLPPPNPSNHSIDLTPSSAI
ncbi:hypothetical protein L1887_40189 [Cichorium endivia]|nr:hypothetical protein L1887_40189 [Cichorium endivia]